MHVGECAVEEVMEEVVGHVEIGTQVAHVVEGVDEVESHQGYGLEDED